MIPILKHLYHNVLHPASFTGARGEGAFLPDPLLTATNVPRGFLSMESNNLPK